MDGQTNNFDVAGSNQGNIMKELSDIKTSLAVNTETTSNIKESVNDVKGVVKEMQRNYITQEQHKVLVDSIADHESRLRKVEMNITQIMTWGSIGVIFLGLVDIAIRIFIH